jgi:hypothetical protein
MSNSVTVSCSVCGFGVSARAPSPAAPVISALTDVLRPKGWTYSVGVVEMATGDYRPVCPSCSEANRCQIATGMESARIALSRK